MPAPRDLRTHTRVLEDTVLALAALVSPSGRLKDAGGGLLSVTFARNGRRFTATVPIERLEGRKQASQAVDRAILALNRAITRGATIA